MVTGLKKIIFSVFCLWPMAAFAGVPHMPIPPWLETTLVAEEMVVNGLPARVHEVAGEYDLEKVLQFYRKKWRSGKQQSIKETAIAPWHILNRLDAPYLYTVQLKQTGPFSIQGYLVVSDTKALDKKQIQEKVPAISGSRTLNDYRSNDLGKKGRVILLSNTHTLGANHDYYDTYYRDHGWYSEINRKSEDTAMQVFKQGNKEATIVISKLLGKTRVVINLVEY